MGRLSSSQPWTLAAAAALCAAGAQAQTAPSGEPASPLADAQLTWHEQRHNAEGLTLAHKHGAPKGESPAEKAVEAASGEAAA